MPSVSSAGCDIWIRVADTPARGPSAIGARDPGCRNVLVVLLAREEGGLDVVPRVGLDGIRACMVGDVGACEGGRGFMVTDPGLDMDAVLAGVIITLSQAGLIRCGTPVSHGTSEDVG